MLNTEVVDFYMKILEERDKELCTRYPSSRLKLSMFSVYFINYLLEKSGDYDYSNVRRATAVMKIDIFQMDKSFCPFLHYNENPSRWAMVVAYMQQKCIIYYDSKPLFDGSKYVNGVLRWIQDEAVDKKDGLIINALEWTLYNIHDFVEAQVFNSHDCGVYVLMCADFLSDNLKIDFGEGYYMMDQFRKNICASVLRGEVNYSI